MVQLKIGKKGISDNKNNIWCKINGKRIMNKNTELKYKMKLAIVTKINRKNDVNENFIKLITNIYLWTFNIIIAIRLKRHNRSCEECDMYKVLSTILEVRFQVKAHDQIVCK